MIFFHLESPRRKEQDPDTEKIVVDSDLPKGIESRQLVARNNSEEGKISTGLTTQKQCFGFIRFNTDQDPAFISMRIQIHGLVTQK